MSMRLGPPKSCQEDDACNAWTWHAGGSEWCILKSSDGGRAVKASYVSGPKYCDCIEQDTDYFGNDLRTLYTKSAKECQGACQEDDACNAWTWHAGGSEWCILKSSDGGRAVKASYVSGPKACASIYEYSYSSTGSWSSCSASCGGGTQTRSVTCKRSDGQSVSDSSCSGSKPSTSQSCNTQACAPSYTYSYATGSWAVCSASCGGGTQTRSVTCKRSDGQAVADTMCSGTKPSTSLSCNTQACTTPSTTASPTTTKPADEAPTTSYTYAFSEGSFGSCSESCGGGTRTRTVTCLRSDGQAVADTMCSGTKPSTSDSCNNQPCNTSKNDAVTTTKVPPATSSASKLAQAFHVIAFLALAVVIY
ncbi:thrombospondin [Pseudoscourfieldia marina]